MQIDTSPVYLERWAAMFTLLESIPNDNRFNMQSWAFENRGSECNTTACAAGHAILHPWFNERGFAIEDHMLRKTVRFDGKIEWHVDLTTCTPDTKAASFWGLNSMMDDTPFNPGYCWDVLGLDEGWGTSDDEDDDSWVDSDNYPYSPQEVASVVKEYMLRHWDAPEVEAAIAASTVRYGVDHVHAIAPWNKGQA